MYSQIEKKYNVIYPENENATYITLMNYSDDLKKPYQRWYRYKEGFSIDLVKQLIKEYCKNENGIILDPFMGSGSTLIATSDLGRRSIGFEVNPFSYDLAKLKLSNYSIESTDEFKKAFNEILNSSTELIEEYRLPKLSISDKVFEEHIREFYMTIRKKIVNYSFVYEINRDLLKLGWLANLEHVSNYRKAGNGLKKRKYVKPRIITKSDVLDLLMLQYNNMLEDILNNNRLHNVEIFNQTSLNMREVLESNSISGIIFSPPYANCFDYTEIYKMELWFGEYVHDYPDLKVLRNKSLRSHLNGNLSTDGYETLEITILNEILTELKTKELWDKKIPNMIELYFHDMFKIIRDSYVLLEKEGFCSIVVGNSAYGGVIIPTDLILAEYAKRIGFTVDKIEVDRYIVTSSQQYEITKQNKRFLRESIVCLIK